ncbi:MAG: hypothetical protein EAZ57_03160 [Cytophagales bacterium]|nr:MAG: hypothetical protein EAZ67_03625 [Cytophagales bacterium]TAF61462.1 MAG: hypothetical protein EAZ57_03160 [Cytophagales bacterium]
MKRITINNILCAIFMLVFFASCSYSSEYPIEDQGLPIKSEILGKWTQDAGVTPDYITISKLNDTQYDIKRFAFDTQDSSYKEQSSYKSHLSNLQGTLFMNMESGGQYIFKKLVISSNKLVFSSVTSNIDEEFTNSEDLKAFFLKNKDLSFFYNEGDEIYKRSDDTQQ